MTYHVTHSHDVTVSAGCPYHGSILRALRGASLPLLGWNKAKTGPCCRGNVRANHDTDMKRATPKGGSWSSVSRIVRARHNARQLAGLALLHERSLGRAGKLLAVGAHRFAFAAV